MRGYDITALTADKIRELIDFGERFYVYDKRSKTDDDEEEFWLERDRFAEEHINGLANRNRQGDPDTSAAPTFTRLPP
jgi:hypothetical protein